MREIKFRIIYDTNPPSFEIFDFSNWTDISDFTATLHHFGGLKFQQYTDLKDKNGIEIYEGDIISYKYYKGFSGIEKEIIAKVEYVKGCFGFYEYQNEHDSYFNCFDLDEAIVIGNVYENPELLKKTED